MEKPSYNCFDNWYCQFNPINYVLPDNIHKKRSKTKIRAFKVKYRFLSSLTCRPARVNDHFFGTNVLLIKYQRGKCAINYIENNWEFSWKFFDGRLFWEMDDSKLHSTQYFSTAWVIFKLSHFLLDFLSGG